MKHIHIIVEDKEHKELTKKKGDLTWKEYIRKA